MTDIGHQEFWCVRVWPWGPRCGQRRARAPLPISSPTKSVQRPPRYSGTVPMLCDQFSHERRLTCARFTGQHHEGHFVDQAIFQDAVGHAMGQARIQKGVILQEREWFASEMIKRFLHVALPSSRKVIDRQAHGWWIIRSCLTIRFLLSPMPSCHEQNMGENGGPLFLMR